MKTIKKTLLSVILLCICQYHANALVSGSIVSYTLWKTVTTEDILNRMQSRKIPKALLDTKYDVNIYDVQYLSKWHDGSAVLTSGLYFVPQGSETALPQLVYHHGTRMTKGREDDIQKETNLALGYAVDGYIVLMPDYFGLGHGDKFHIYQQYEPLGQTSVDFLFAVRELNTTLKVKANEQLFLTGYSEGGYAALGTNKLIQEKYADQFTVTATSANAGAYDMAGVQSEAMFKPYKRPQFLPYLLIGLNEVYNIVPDIYAMFQSPYDTIVQKYFDGKHTHDGLEKILPVVPKDMLLDSFVQAYLTDEDFIMHQALKENTLCYWKPENPVQLCHCKGDEVVFFQNSEVALKGMKDSGADDVTLRNPGKKYGHRSCGLFATVYSKMYFDSFLEGSKHGRRGSFSQRFFIRLAKFKKPVEG